MPYVTSSVSYCSFSDVAQELVLTFDGFKYKLWGIGLTSSDLANHANHGNDKVYALVGDVTSSTKYKNNLAVRLATKYACEELVTHLAIHWPDYAFNFSLGDQNVQRGQAVIEGVKVLREHLTKEIQNLEWALSATVEGAKLVDTDREIYTDSNTLPYYP